MTEQRYRFRLYVSGASSRSAQAIANIRAIAEKFLTGQYDLEVIDGYQQAEMLRNDRIVVLPTLVKELPPPTRRLVGDLSEEAKVVIGLGLIPDPGPDG